jgi:hypothetical protein
MVDQASDFICGSGCQMRERRLVSGSIGSGISPGIRRIWNPRGPLGCSSVVERISQELAPVIASVVPCQKHSPGTCSCIPRL